MKKILILLAVLLIVSSLFIGCENKAEESQVETEIVELEDLEEEEKEEDQVRESLDIDYENMTEEDLIDALVEDRNNISVDEYLSLLESYKYAKSDNFENTLNIKFDKTDKALGLLRKDKAVFPDMGLILEKALASPDPLVRGQVLLDQRTGSNLRSALEEEADKMKMLLDLAKTEEDTFVLNQLTNTFRYHMEDPEVADFIFNMSQHEHPLIRSNSTLGISSSQEIDRSLDRLIEMMEDENVDVKGAAYRRVGDLGDDRAVDSLVEVLMDEDREEYHEDAMTSLVKLWLGPPIYDGTSEKAYRATIDYLNYQPRSERMPHFKAINYINSAKRENTSDIESFKEWEGQSTYYNSRELIDPMFEIAKDPDIYYLAPKYAIELVNKYGSRDDFTNLKGVLESSSHPEKEDILEEYNKIWEKNK